MEQQTRTLARAFRQYTTLPARQDWDQVDLDPYLDELSDALAGIIRQFSTAMLDLGNLAVDDPRKHRIFRSQVFNASTTFQQSIKDWLHFYGLTDADARLHEDVRQVLLAPCDEADE